MTEAQIDAKALYAINCIRKYECSSVMRLAMKSRLPIFDRYSAVSMLVALCTGKTEQTIVLTAIMELWESQDYLYAELWNT